MYYFFGLIRPIFSSCWRIFLRIGSKTEGRRFYMRFLSLSLSLYRSDCKFKSKRFTMSFWKSMGLLLRFQVKILTESFTMIYCLKLMESRIGLTNLSLWPSTYKNIEESLRLWYLTKQSYILPKIKFSVFLQT